MIIEPIPAAPSEAVEKWLPIGQSAKSKNELALAYMEMLAEYAESLPKYPETLHFKKRECETVKAESDRWMNLFQTAKNSGELGLAYLALLETHLDGLEARESLLEEVL